MSITVIVTDAGRAALVNAENTGTDPVTIAEFGVSATAVTPLPTATALTGEIKRISTLSGDVVADDTIHLIVRDQSADAFTLRSFAFYLADGTLFAIYGQAGAILEKTAQSLMLLALDVKFGDIDAALLTFGDANFLNPPATETVQGVAELATQAESDAGTDDQRIVTPKKMNTSVLAWVASWFSDVWRASNDGSGSGLDADLLDGQQGSWYSNIIARLGFTPADKAGDAFTGTISTPRVEAGDALHNISISGGNPRHQFDPGDYFAFDRISNVGQWTIAAVVQASVDSGGFLNARVGLKAAGNVAWHAGNDGSGSGLDADLLDGQQGSYYLPAASYTAADVKTKLLTVDGSGSGLDADLLDGQDGSYYTNIPARLGYTPLNSAGGTVTGNLAVTGAFYPGNDGQFALYKSGANPLINFDANDYFLYNRAGNQLDFYIGGAVAAQFRSNKDFYAGAALIAQGAVFAGNGTAYLQSDGNVVGPVFPSGIHAYIGQRAAEFGSNANGYWKKQYCPNTGHTVIEQWGRITALANGATTITFPIPFTDGGSIVCLANGVGNLVNTAQDNTPTVFSIPNLQQAQVWSAENVDILTFWRAIGI
jgi:hypothetical protein